MVVQKLIGVIFFSLMTLNSAQAEHASGTGGNGGNHPIAPASLPDANRRAGAFLGFLPAGTTLYAWEKKRKYIPYANPSNPHPFYTEHLHSLALPMVELAKETGGIVTMCDPANASQVFEQILWRNGTGGSQGMRQYLDVMVVVDSTGSMASTIDAIKKKLQELSDEIRKVRGENFAVRLGLVDMKDFGDYPPTKVAKNLTHHLENFDAAWSNIRINGGSGECAGVDALIHATQGQIHSPNARKIILFMTDTITRDKSDLFGPLQGNTFPHRSPNGPGATLQEVTKKLKDDGYTVYPIMLMQ